MKNKVTKNAKNPRSTKTTKTSTGPPTNWHSWTDQQIEYLCCLRIKTDLSYKKISTIFEVCLGVQVCADILRYKCNVLKGTLAPSQEKRRVRDFGGDNAWSKFSNLPDSSPEVQAVFRDCGIYEPCAGTRESLALLPQPRHSLPASYTPATPPARRPNAAASEQTSSASAMESSSSSSTELQSTPEALPCPSARLFLPPTPNRGPPSPIDSSDFIPYEWDYFEIVILCVLSIHARLSSERIAEILNLKHGSEVNEEDVEMKIDELSGEECGIWEEWGVKEIGDWEVETVLSRLGLRLSH